MVIDLKKLGCDAPTDCPGTRATRGFSNRWQPMTPNQRVTGSKPAAYTKKVKTQNDSRAASPEGIWGCGLFGAWVSGCRRETTVFALRLPQGRRGYGF